MDGRRTQATDTRLRARSEDELLALVGGRLVRRMIPTGQAGEETAAGRGKELARDGDRSEPGVPLAWARHLAAARQKDVRVGCPGFFERPPRSMPSIAAEDDMSNFQRGEGNTAVPPPRKEVWRPGIFDWGVCREVSADEEMRHEMGTRGGSLDEKPSEAWG